MTMPSALPPRRTVYESPTTAPEQMSDAEKAAFAAATVAAVAASSGEQKKSVTNAVVLMLIPLLRALDPYDDSAIERFAAKAAEAVEMGRQEIAKVSWSAISQYLAAYDVTLPYSAQRPVGRGRATDLDVAYRRVAADYRKRMAAGTVSIQKMIAQVEEEQFQALGGAAVAQERTGESNAEVKGQDRSLGASGKAKSSDRGGEGGSGASSSGSGDAGKKRVPKSPVDRARPDRQVNVQADDWSDDEDVDREAQQRRAEEEAADAAYDAEQELRQQARLTEEQQADLLEQVAQHEMEVRLERMVNDDMGIASRQASQDAMLAAPRGRITGYRRVVHPELSESKTSCGLCVVASTRVYRISELLPIHNLCKCEVVPIIGGNDPGAQINDEDLGVLYDEAGTNVGYAKGGGAQLKREEYVVFDHPELGPVLRNKKHSLQAVGFSKREASEDHKLKVKQDRTKPGENENA